MLYRSRLLLTSMTTAALAAGSLVLATTSERAPDTNIRSHEGTTVSQQYVEQLHDQLNDVLGLSRSTLLDLPHDTMEPDKLLSVNLPIADENYTVTLWPHSVRAKGFRVRVQLDDGSLQEVDPGIERTMRGHVEELPGSIAVGSLFPEGLRLMVLLPSGEAYWLEPASTHLDDVDASVHVLYDEKDSDCDVGECGVPVEWEEAFAAERSGGQSTISASDDCQVAEIAIDADFHYYQALQSNVNNVINDVSNVIETINVQYEEQVGIRHEITEIIVRTSNGQNPYTTNNAGTLLNQFQSVWSSSPESSIPRDLAHLFTGRNLNGGTIGVAWLGTVCDPFWGGHYALSQRLTNSNCMTDLVAHEIGHNWGALHCSCPTNTMNPSLTCANSFSSTSINTITSFKNSVNCLEGCTPPAPANSTCSGAVFLTSDTTISNVNATSTGDSESEVCTESSDGQIESDVWYAVQATCSGEMAISLCDANFSATMALYEACPDGSNQAIACDSSSCPDSNQPMVVLDVEFGDLFWLRIGGMNGDQGTGTLIAECEPDVPACQADLTGPDGEPDGAIDVFDLLAVIGDWGPCSGSDCPADLTGPDGEPDGTVDVFDLLKIIGEWGQCDS